MITPFAVELFLFESLALCLRDHLSGFVWRYTVALPRILIGVLAGEVGYQYVSAFKTMTCDALFAVMQRTEELFGGGPC
jgi:hypothetical protein